MAAKIILAASGTALLALAATASAGPMSMSSSQIVAPSAPTEQVQYWRYGYPYYYGLGNLAAAPLPASGNYCATPVRTCLLYESGWLGTGCSCRVPGGYARGTVVE
jgi:hypothetical protein